MQNKYVKWIALIVVLIVVLLVISLVKKSSYNTTSYNAPQTSTTTPSAPSGSVAYQQAVVAYKDHRIQFDAACSATPSNMVLKSGTKVMLDNRANVATKIVIDGVTYNIGAYDYKIVTLPTITSTSNKSLLLNCGAKVHVATITLQK